MDPFESLSEINCALRLCVASLLEGRIGTALVYGQVRRYCSSTSFNGAKNGEAPQTTLAWVALRPRSV